MTINSVAPEKSVSELINDLCPQFGQKAKRVPLFDGQKHAYLVDQYLTPRGNRCLTYASVSSNMIVEFVLGHHHCMEYINSSRLMVPDGSHFKVVQTYKWDLKTHFSNDELHGKVKFMISSYIMQNAGGVRISETELDAAVNKIVSGLFSMTPDYLAEGGRQVLEAYCRDANLCDDFARQLPAWEED